MTKEELKKEAEKNIFNLKNNLIKVSGKSLQINEGDYTQGYLDSAEPREKRIEELEKENETLKKQLDALSGDVPWSELKDVSEVTKKLTEAKEENAELKARLQKKINTTTVSDYPYSALKLEEAKELLKRWLKLYNTNTVKGIITDTEQFLNDDGCPDCLCEDCTKEDCTVRKLGLVEK